jgi:hypothetical protein
MLLALVREKHGSGCSSNRKPQSGWLSLPYAERARMIRTISASASACEQATFTGERQCGLQPVRRWPWWPSNGRTGCQRPAALVEDDTQPQTASGLLAWLQETDAVPAPARTLEQRAPLTTRCTRTRGCHGKRCYIGCDMPVPIRTRLRIASGRLRRSRHGGTNRGSEAHSGGHRRALAWEGSDHSIRPSGPLRPQA